MLKDMFLDPRVWVSNFSPQKGLVLASFFFLPKFQTEDSGFCQRKTDKDISCIQDRFRSVRLAAVPGTSAGLELAIKNEGARG